MMGLGNLTRCSGFLSRLRRDRRGNTLVLGAVALVPMLTMAGAAIDMSRLYVVKVRLQQACDAGVLAGRKNLDTTNASSTIDSNAAAQAQTFFANNFHTGYFQTTGLKFTPSKSGDNFVAGTAQATVPMALMGMFGAQPVKLNVSCTAEYDIADADIMFVLDTTGSMACLTSDNTNNCNNYVVGNTSQNPDGTYSVAEKNGSRISGLRSAVLSFFDTVTSNADSSTNFRFGFVPYSGAVNVGGLLQSAGYMTTASTANYQSRVVSGDANSGSPTSSSSSNVSSNTCATGTTRSPSTGYNSSGTATVKTVTWSKNSNNANGTCTTSSQTVVPNWTYKQTAFPIQSFMNGSAVTNPAQVTGATSTWQGCIEERWDTSGETGSSFDPANPPLSLAVDGTPSANNQRWNPMWPDVIFARQSTPETSSAARTNLTRFYGSTGYEYAALLNELPCPKVASRLTNMQLPAGSSSSAKSALRTQMQNYMLASNGFRPYGVTYHDIGMTWGTRLLAPNGLFAADTAAWSGHNSPNRFIIFLTDGTMEVDETAYTSYGIEQWDNRTGSGGNSSTLNDNHNARFVTACTMAKNRNIKVFVIAYAQTLTDQLTSCASPGQAYYASDTTSLNNAFASIAKQVAMLRLSQ